MKIFLQNLYDVVKSIDSSQLIAGDEKVLIAACVSVGDVSLIQLLLEKFRSINRLTPQLVHIALSLSMKECINRDEHSLEVVSKAREAIVGTGMTVSGLINIFFHCLTYNIPLHPPLVEEIFLRILIPKGYVDESTRLFQLLLQSDHIILDKQTLVSIIQSLAYMSHKLNDLSILVVYTKFLMENKNLMRDDTGRIDALLTTFFRTCVIHGDIQTAFAIHFHSVRSANRRLMDYFEYVFAAYHNWRDRLPPDYHIAEREEWNRIHNRIDYTLSKFIARSYDRAPSALNASILKYLIHNKDMLAILLYFHRTHVVLKQSLSTSITLSLAKLIHRFRRSQSPSSMSTVLAVMLFQYSLDNKLIPPLLLQQEYPWLYHGLIEDSNSASVPKDSAVSSAVPHETAISELHQLLADTEVLLSLPVKNYRYTWTMLLYHQDTSPSGAFRARTFYEIPFPVFSSYFMRRIQDVLQQTHLHSPSPRSHFLQLTKVL